MWIFIEADIGLRDRNVLIDILPILADRNPRA